MARRPLIQPPPSGIDYTLAEYLAILALTLNNMEQRIRTLESDDTAD